MGLFSCTHTHTQTFFCQVEWKRRCSSTTLRASLVRQVIPSIVCTLCTYYTLHELGLVNYLCSIQTVYTWLTLEKIRGKAWDDFTHDTVAP